MKIILILAGCIALASAQTLQPTGPWVTPIRVVPQNSNSAVAATSLTGTTELTANTTFAWTLAQAGTTGFEAGKWFIANNVGAGTITITATTSTFSGCGASGSVLAIPAGQSNRITSAGGNWIVDGCGGGSGGMVYPGGTGVPQVVGGASWGTTLTPGTGNNNLFQLGGGGWGGVCGPLGALLCGVAGQVDIDPLVIPRMAQVATITGAWLMNNAGNVLYGDGSHLTGVSGGQALTSGIARCVSASYPCWGTTSGVSASPTASQNLGVVGYRVENPFSSLGIKQVGTYGNTGTGKTAIGIYDSSCILLRQSATISSSASAAFAYTLTSVATVTTPWYYVAFTTEGVSTSYSVLNDGVTVVRPMFDAMTNAGQVYSFTTAATQGGGIGTAITMPGTCGGVTRLTGGDALVPFLVMVTN